MPENKLLGNRDEKIRFEKSEESTAVFQVISADGKSWRSFALLRSRNDDEFGKLCV